MIQIILSAIDDKLIKAWKSVATELPGVLVHQGSILDIKCDAIVSPANSFGFMDGGIDYQYTKFFGKQVQNRLQSIINQNHHGELIVGTAEIVLTNHDSIPYLIAAPTMRVPMILPNDTVNPYLATRAVLILIKYGPTLPCGKPIKTIAIPGLGTGVGRVPPEICARQVKQAIEDVLYNQAFPLNWKIAQQNHQRLYTDKIKDLQH